MGTRKNGQNTAEAPQTPANPPARRAATTIQAATATKAKRTSNKNNTRKSLISSLRTRRMRSSADRDSQFTLTQFDYVRKSQPVEQKEEALDYIDNEGKNNKDGIEVIDLETGSSDNDNGTEYHPSTIRSSKTQHTKPRAPRSSLGSNIKSTKFLKSGSRYGRKPKSGKLELSKEEKKRNKTLTQMDFVRRFIVLDDSEDERGLDYIEQKIPNLPGKTDKMKHEGVQSSNKKEDMDEQSARKRQKLNSGCDAPTSPAVVRSEDVVESSMKTATAISHPSPNPTTPQRYQRFQKFEIPSSQTPEIPRQHIIPSPEIRTATGFLLAQLSSSSINQTPEKEQVSSVADKAVTPRPFHPALQSRTTIPESQNGVNFCSSPLLETVSPATSRPLTDKLELESGDSGRKEIIDQMVATEAGSFLKAVVYETDAETDYSDFDDGLPRPSSPSGEPTPCGNEKGIVISSDNIPQSDDSEDLPPPVRNSGTDLEAGDGTDSDLVLHSDASLYYRRPPQYTQFPAGPVPIMDTQRIAELFPEENTQSPSTAASLPADASPKNHNSDIICPQTQTQTQSQDPANMSTQLVPESSPVRNVEASPIQGFRRPPPRESVVLVESSQPVDKINRPKSAMSQRLGPRRLFSTTQWLTDSVIQSLPPPPPWLLSQDSVGEPYPDDQADQAG